MEALVEASPERVIGAAERFFTEGWQDPKYIMRRENAIDVYTKKPMLPESCLGWAFHLTATLVTLGGWLLVWLIWAMIKDEITVSTLTLSAYPEGDATSVKVESNNPEWQRHTEEWLTRTFSREESG